MNKLTFIWIDDENDKAKPNKSELSKSLEIKLDVKIDFIKVFKQDLGTIIKEMKKDQKRPDLLIIDHNLNNTLDTEKLQTGSSGAELLKDDEEWKSIPIVSVTNIPLENIDYHKQSIYDEIIDANELDKKSSMLVTIANDFRQLRLNQPKTIKDFILLLKAPKYVEKLEKIIPFELRKLIETSDKGLPSAMYKWIKQTLIQKPGFLYDKLWAATTLGITIEAFDKIKTLFDKAKYNGIFLFTQEDSQRWWQSSLKQILFSEVDNTDEVLPWKLGRELENIEAKDYSKCHYCGKEYPEIVGFTDEAAKTQVPLHIGCSELHPRFDSLLYFEEIRIQRS